MGLHPLEGLRRLRDEMASKDWVVACFPFMYKRQGYFVLIERYVPSSKAPEHMLVQLTFVDRRDTTRTLTAPANSQRIAVGVSALRKFFGIDYLDNLGDLREQFYAQLGRAIPAHLSPLTPEERQVVIRQLDLSASEDPRKVHCFGARRNGTRTNGTPGHRSAYNSQKTELLRPELYKRLKHDLNISFLYSVDSDDEQTDAQILDRFAGR